MLVYLQHRRTLALFVVDMVGGVVVRATGPYDWRGVLAAPAPSHAPELCERIAAHRRDYAVVAPERVDLARRQKGL